MPPNVERATAASGKTKQQLAFVIGLTVLVLGIVCSLLAVIGIYVYRQINNEFMVTFKVTTNVPASLHYDTGSDLVWVRDIQQEWTKEIKVKLSGTGFEYIRVQVSSERDPHARVTCEIHVNGKVRSTDNRPGYHEPAAYCHYNFEDEKGKLFG